VKGPYILAWLEILRGAVKHQNMGRLLWTAGSN